MKNKYAVKIGEKVAELQDGTLLFATSKSAARKDMARYVWEWRGSRHNRSRTAVRHGDGRLAHSYTLKDRGAVVGELRIVEL